LELPVKMISTPLISMRQSPHNLTLRRHSQMAGAVAPKNIRLKKRRKPSEPPMTTLNLPTYA
jgi:hypothetical protein